MADALLFHVQKKSATDQCYIFSNFFDDVESIHVGAQNTPTLPWFMYLEEIVIRTLICVSAQKTQNSSHFDLDYK